mmetsp:Transcript_21984/g.68434  ORF Transcript_21984/g.68434 Transcript_21984/m.68434 type:complete len:333 (-) Transcript_21984:213-1211(-)
MEMPSSRSSTPLPGPSNTFPVAPPGICPAAPPAAPTPAALASRRAPAGPPLDAAAAPSPPGPAGAAGRPVARGLDAAFPVPAPALPALPVAFSPRPARSPDALCALSGPRGPLRWAAAEGTWTLILPSSRCTTTDPVASPSGAGSSWASAGARSVACSCVCASEEDDSWPVRGSGDRVPGSLPPDTAAAALAALRERLASASACRIRFSSAARSRAISLSMRWASSSWRLCACSTSRSSGPGRSEATNSFTRRVDTSIDEPRGGGLPRRPWRKELADRKLPPPFASGWPATKPPPASVVRGRKRPTPWPAPLPPAAAPSSPSICARWASRRV